MNVSRAVAVVVIAAVASGCTVTVDSHSEIVREEKRFTVSGVPDVRVTTFDGAIQVQAWDKPDVLIEIERRGPNREAVDALEIKSDQTGNVIELEVRRPRRESFRVIGMSGHASARLFVWVPASTDLRARTGDGSIQLEGVSGRIEARTGDGRIRASGISGDMTFNTGDGGVTVDGAEGRLSVDTGDGAVSASGKLSVVKLHTGDGSIIFRGAPGTTMTDNWEITTGDGAVAVYLPADFNAEIDAHTGDGSISSDLNVARTDRDARGRRTLRGTVGTGGKLLRVRSGDGSIRFKVN